MATLPPISDIRNIATPSGSGLALVQVQVDVHCAVIGLNQRNPELEDRIRYSNRLKASRTLASLAGAIKDSSAIYAHVPLVVCTPSPRQPAHRALSMITFGQFPMQLAMSVLVEALERGQTGSKLRSAIRELQTDILAIATFLSELPGFFPRLRE
jgi:hypothetical protein